jgi:hypothetical protein
MFCESQISKMLCYEKQYEKNLSRRFVSKHLDLLNQNFLAIFWLQHQYRLASVPSNSAMKFCITALRIVTFCMMDYIVTHIINDSLRNIICHWMSLYLITLCWVSLCWMSFMLDIVMLNVVWLGVIMLRIMILNVVKLSVVVTHKLWTKGLYYKTYYGRNLRIFVIS